MSFVAVAQWYLLCETLRCAALDACALMDLQETRLFKRLDRNSILFGKFPLFSLVVSSFFSTALCYTHCLRKRQGLVQNYLQRRKFRP